MWHGLNLKIPEEDYTRLRAGRLITPRLAVGWVGQTIVFRRLSSVRPVRG